MKTNVEKVSAVEKRLHVEVPAEEVSKRIAAGFSEVRRMVPIRGFRKGKAPMEMVRRLFRESVEGDVAETLVKESIGEAVKANAIKVLSFPKIDGAKIREGEAFAFTATFEVVPDVEPVGYKGIPVTRETPEVSGEEVGKALEGLRESFAQYQPVERGAFPPDLVDGTYSAKAGEDVIAKDATGSFLLGSGYPLGTGVEEKIAGIRPGEERSFETAFPKEFPNDRYAGKAVAFAFKANAVREKVLPPLDEDFVKNFGDIESLDALRTKLGERLVHEASERIRLSQEEAIKSALLERNAFEVPKTLVDRQILRMIEDTAHRLSSQGVDLRKIDMNVEKMRERFAPAAEKAVRVSLLVDAVARKEDIDVSFSEIEAEMKAIAEGAKTDYEKVKEVYGSEERMDALRDGLVERKTMKFLLDNAEWKEKEA